MTKKIPSVFIEGALSEKLDNGFFPSTLVTLKQKFFDATLFGKFLKNYFNVASWCPAGTQRFESVVLCE